MESIWTIILLVAIVIVFGGLLVCAFHPVNRYYPTEQDKHRHDKYPPYYF